METVELYAQFFHKTDEINSTPVFLCSIGKMRASHGAQVLEYVDFILTNYTNQPWILHFDCSGILLKHISWINSLANLIKQKYECELSQIDIMNTTLLIRTYLNIKWPFLTQKIKSIIRLNSHMHNFDMDDDDPM